jgi:hypothetical protein
MTGAGAWAMSKNIAGPATLIFLALLIIAYDQLLNGGSWLETLVGYVSAVMWKIGPI